MKKSLRKWATKTEISRAKKAADIYIHKMKAMEPCDHEWNNGGHNPTECLKCGMDFTYYIHMECP